MPEKKFLIPKTDCGAPLVIRQERTDIADASYTPEKSHPCGGCTYVKNRQGIFIGPIETDRNRSCIEGLAPVSRVTFKHNLYKYFPELNTITDVYTSFTVNSLLISQLVFNEHPVAGMLLFAGNIADSLISTRKSL